MVSITSCSGLSTLIVLDFSLRDEDEAGAGGGGRGRRQASRQRGRNQMRSQGFPPVRASFPPTLAAAAARVNRVPELSRNPSLISKVAATYSDRPERRQRAPAREET